MDYLFFQAAAVNGFDSFGHYLRAGLIVNQCSTYAVEPTTGCSANFRRASTRERRRGAPSMPRDSVLAWTARVLQGLDPDPPAKRAPKGEPPRQAVRAPRRRRAAAREGERGRGAAAPRRRAPGRAGAGADAPAPRSPRRRSRRRPRRRRSRPRRRRPPRRRPPAATTRSQPLLDYLFGGDD